MPSATTPNCTTTEGVRLRAELSLGLKAPGMEIGLDKRQNLCMASWRQATIVRRVRGRSEAR